MNIQYSLDKLKRDASVERRACSTKAAVIVSRLNLFKRNARLCHATDGETHDKTQAIEVKVNILARGAASSSFVVDLECGNYKKTAARGALHRAASPVAW